MKVKACDIVWETDGLDVALPTNVEIPQSFLAKSCLGDIDNYLSNEYGFLVKSYSLSIE